MIIWIESTFFRALDALIQFFKWCFLGIPKEQIVFKKPISQVITLEDSKGKPIHLTVDFGQDYKGEDLYIGIQYTEKKDKYNLKLILSSSEESLRKSIKK